MSTIFALIARASAMTGLSNVMVIGIVVLIAVALFLIVVKALVGHPEKGTYFMEDGTGIPDWTAKKL